MDTLDADEIPMIIKALRELHDQIGWGREFYIKCYLYLQSIGLIQTQCKDEETALSTYVTDYLTWASSPKEQFDAIIKLQERDGFGSDATMSQDFLDLLTVITLFWKQFPDDAPRYMFYLDIAVWLLV